MSVERFRRSEDGEVTYVGDEYLRHSMASRHVAEEVPDIIIVRAEQVWSEYGGKGLGGHLVAILVVGHPKTDSSAHAPRQRHHRREHTSRDVRRCA